jgi:hypothetical protein
MPFAEAYEWAVSGKIRDGKTAIGLMRAQHVRATQKALAGCNPAKLP